MIKFKDGRESPTDMIFFNMLYQASEILEDEAAVVEFTDVEHKNSHNLRKNPDCDHGE